MSRVSKKEKERKKESVTTLKNISTETTETNIQFKLDFEVN